VDSRDEPEKFSTAKYPPSTELRRRSAKDGKAKILFDKIYRIQRIYRVNS
jgi:hypothetical protein